MYIPDSQLGVGCLFFLSVFWRLFQGFLFCFALLQNIEWEGGGGVAVVRLFVLDI